MEKKINKPIKQGVVKVPVVMQLEALECGAACLCMVLAYYNKWITLEQAREDCGVSRDGQNAKNILKAARFYGLVADGYRYELNSIKNECTFPCIIFWNFNHFVVLDGYKNGKFYLNDPAKGDYAVSEETFSESFTGICLEFKPSENFTPSGKPKSIWTFVKKRFKGTGDALVFTILTSIIVALIGFIRPSFSRVFLDYLLDPREVYIKWAFPFIVFLGLFNLVEIIMSMIQSIYSLRINGKMASVGNATYMWKVLNLPIKFFTQRMSGDIQARQADNAVIANTIIETFAPLLLNFAMLIFYFAVMIRYSVILTIIGISSMIINAFVSKYISEKRINITRVSMRDNAKLSSTTIAGIEMIETIKSSGAENGFFKKWAGYQSSVNTQNVKFLKMNQYLGIIPQFVSSIASNLVLFIGVYLTINGKFTVGMIMAFQGFLSSFMGPAMTLVSAGQTIQEMQTQMERIEDVMEYPNDDILKESLSDFGYYKLNGNVELRNVTFGYSPLADPFIKDFNMNISQGKSIAIVGASGCGKSTISKLLSGLYKPWSGEILFDGRPLSEIPKNVFRNSVAVVDQDIVLFEDSIASNVKMWDISIEDFEMILAAKDACVHDDIMKRPNGYHSKVMENGKDFSGGQKQRLEIARALAQEPSIIILDEATSALDAETEYKVANAIKERGITCIIIAHRLSTIRSCDEIIVMDRGVIKERGTHKELMNNSKLYYDLVSSD